MGLRLNDEFMSSEQTLYERLGGEGTISKVVDAFYERVLADERLAPLFEDTDMNSLRAHQTQFLSSVTGGPGEYTGADMQTAHRHLGIEREQFALVAAHLRESLEAFDVPEEDVDDVMAAVADLEDDIVTA
jgi:hemoglobin